MILTVGGLRDKAWLQERGKKVTIRFMLGVWELLLILLIVLLVFGRRLPEVGEGLGKGIRSFRKSIKEPDEIDVTPEKGRKRTKDGKDS